MRVLLGLAMLILASADARAQPSAPERLVKATFLYRFTSFVTWPPQSFSSADAPIVLCISGGDPFGRNLDAVVRDYRAGGRRIALRRLRTFRGNEGCHVLYVGSGAQTIQEALRAARTRPVLTVTDEQDRHGLRGMIHFVVVDNRVRFHIDEADAAEGGLMIDSRLLNLAVSVRRRAAS
jgi:hypothetical protein